MAKRRAEELALERAARGEPIVIVNPGGVFGPGDWKPTPSGRFVLEFFRYPAFAATSGGISVTDVDDVVEGHRLAMERGRIGERYILAGDNMTILQIAQLLNDIAGIEKRVFDIGKGTALLGARLLELHGRMRGIEPPFTYKLVRDYAFNFIWGSSEKAERELGYTHRPARQTLSRSLRWYLEHGYIPEKVARALTLVGA